MDAVVQLIRNALCCCKDLHLFKGTNLDDPAYTAEFYRFPKPMNQTTPLELLICPTQLFACISTTFSGYLLIVDSGYKKLVRVNRLIEMRANKSSSSSTADRIVNEGLAKARSDALKSIFIGINVISIGISFFWLFCNSLHVTETDWIGGVQGLINALTVMEIGLLPLLYYMLEDGFGLLAKSKRVQALVSVLTSSKTGFVPQENLTAETYSWIVTNGWTPFWDKSVDSFEPLPSEMTETKQMNQEVSKLNTTLDAVTGKQKDAADKDKAAMSQTLDKTAARLEGEAAMFRMEGYREFLYFLLNLVAFYGYLLGIIVYYYDKEEFQPYHVGYMKFWMNNDDADWYGNFAGDLMWTIEPIVILTSPSIMNWMKPKIAKTAKAKTD